MPPWLHPLMQHPQDLDEARSGDAVEQDVDGLSHPCLTAADTHVSEVKAPNSTKQVGAVARHGGIRLGGDFAHGRRQERRIASPALGTPSIGAGSEYLHKIASRRR